MNIIQEVTRYVSIVFFLLPLMAMFTFHPIGYAISLIWGAIGWIVLLMIFTKFSVTGNT